MTKKQDKKKSFLREVNIKKKYRSTQKYLSKEVIVIMDPFIKKSTSLVKYN